MSKQAEKTLKEQVYQSREVEEEVIRRLIRDVVAPKHDLKLPNNEEDKPYKSQY